jgi:hypothetical protein
VYSEHVVIGQAEIGARSFLVRFESKFFDGLERIRTAQGFEFRKAGQRVTEYPDTLTVVLEPIAPMENMPSEEFYSGPRKVTVKWLDDSHRVIDSKSGDLRVDGHFLACCCENGGPQPVGLWPELPLHPSMFYTAEIAGIKQPLATDVEVVVTGKYNLTLGIVRGWSFYFSSPAVSRESASQVAKNPHLAN